ncbi:MAG: hypothetical protein KBS81_03175, partial [Spirochaetales bacterium]|nr:hypothetical protein [Candidatus Physcosoma equi]
MIVLYVLGHEASFSTFSCREEVLVVPVLVPDWNRDLSPWKAKAVFNGEDFSGGADAFLRLLLEKTIP